MGGKKKLGGKNFSKPNQKIEKTQNFDQSKEDQERDNPVDLEYEEDSEDLVDRDQEPQRGPKQGKPAYEEYEQEDEDEDEEMGVDMGSFDIAESNQDIISNNQYEEEENQLNWGKRKQNYYEDVEQSGESEVEQMVKEANELYEFQQNKLNENDFFDDLQKEEKENLQFDDKQDQKEQSDQTAKPSAGFFAQNPEISVLLKQCQKAFQTIEENQAVLESLEEMTLKKDPSILQFLRNQLEINILYVNSILFYIKLKASQQPIKHHTIIKNLLSQKTILTNYSSLQDTIQQKIGELLMNQKKLEQKNGSKKQAKKESVNTSSNQGSVKGPQKQNQEATTQNQQSTNGQLVQPKILDLDDSDDEVMLYGPKKSTQFAKKNGLGDDFGDEDDDDSNLFNDDLDFGDDEGDDLDDDLDGLGGGKDKIRQKVKRNPEEGEDEFYKEAQNQLNEAKLAKKQAQNEKQQVYLEEFQENNKLEEVEDDEGRKINYQIFKNKGLTRKRQKTERNSRVKNRQKYDTALSKLKSKGQFVRQKELKYDGEQTGIKSGIIRGNKLG